MLFKTLGTADAIAVMMLMGAAILPGKFLVWAAIYLLAKGAAFYLISKDFASVGDLISGAYLLVLSYGINIPLVHGIVLFWLLQKTIMTFIAIGIKATLFYYEHKEDLIIPFFYK